MTRKSLDDRIAELQAKKAREERHQRARVALDVIKLHLRAREYTQALVDARGLVADLEALVGGEQATKGGDK